MIEKLILFVTRCDNGISIETTNELTGHSTIHSGIWTENDPPLQTEIELATFDSTTDGNGIQYCRVNITGRNSQYTPSNFDFCLYRQVQDNASPDSIHRKILMRFTAFAVGFNGGGTWTQSDPYSPFFLTYRHVFNEPLADTSYLLSANRIGDLLFASTGVGSATANAVSIGDDILLGRTPSVMRLTASDAGVTTKDIRPYLQSGTNSVVIVGGLDTSHNEEGGNTGIGLLTFDIRRDNELLQHIDYIDNAVPVFLISQFFIDIP